MTISDLISECTAYDFKSMLEEKRPKSWLKSVSAFANGLGGSLFFGIDNDGAAKALDGYKDELKPTFKSTPAQFQTTIYASADTYSVGDLSEIKLTERQLKIINLIKESPSITAKQMSETLSVSSRTIERDLSALQKLSVLKREGKDNCGIWVLLKQFVYQSNYSLN